MPRLFQSSLLCAGYQEGDIGACPGDSGSPLVKFMIRADRFGGGTDMMARGRKPFYRQVGVVHGAVRRCGDPDFPGIYGRVGDEENLSFIMESIGQMIKRREKAIKSRNNKNQLTRGNEQFTVGGKQPMDFSALTYLDQLLIVGGNGGLRQNAAQLLKMGKNGLETCKNVPNYPFFVEGARTEVLDNGDRVVVCGGLVSDTRVLNNCYQMDLTRHILEWQEISSMKTQRQISASTVTPNGEMWMTGGSTIGQNVLDSTEILVNDQWERGPQLPVPMQDHCVQQINDNEYIFIGGGEKSTAQNFGLSHSTNNVRIYNWNNRRWRDAAKMKYPRTAHYCFRTYVYLLILVLVKLISRSAKQLKKFSRLKMAKIS